MMNPDILSQVEAVLGDDGLTAREVHKRVGEWAPSTIAQALRELVSRGRARFEGDWPKTNLAARRRFFRARAA